MLKNKYLFQFSLVFVLVLIDIFTKNYVKLFDFDFQFSYFFIEFTKNTGSAFSMFSSFPIYNYLVIFISVIALSLLIYFYTNKNYEVSMPYFLIFFLSGLIGNLVDRINNGFVIDIIGIENLFVFNFADFYLTIAGFILIITYFKKEDIYFFKRKQTFKNNNIKN